MNIRLDSTKLISQYKEEETSKGVDPEEVLQQMQSFYGKNPVYPESPNDSIGEIRDQAQMLCDHMEKLGFQNFPHLMNKFKVAPKKKADIELLQSIKQAMETILYLVETSKGMSKEELAQQYKDRSFICEEGTLTNLQGIMAEISLGKQGLEAYIQEAKRTFITQQTMEMYNVGSFMEFPFVRRLQRGMEIHNVTALLNSVADDFGLRKKDKKEDHYLKNPFLIISKASASKLKKTISKSLDKQESVSAMIDQIATNVTLNLPRYSENKYANMNEFTQEVSETLEKLELGIDASAIVKIKDYMPCGYKENVQDIIRDAVLVHMHEKGIVQSSEAEKAKLRTQLQQSLDDYSENPAISKEVLENAKKKGLLSYALQYAIESNLVLDEDNLGTPDPLKYAIEHGIEIDGMDAKEYTRRKAEEDFGKANTDEERQAVEDKLRSVRDGDSPEAIFQQLKDLAQDLSKDSMVKSLLNKEDIRLLADAREMVNLASLKNTFEKVVESLEDQTKHIEENIKLSEHRLKQSKLKTLGAILKNCAKAAGAALTGKISIARIHFEKAKSGLSILRANKDEKQGIVDKIKAQRDKTLTKKKWVERLKDKSKSEQLARDLSTKAKEV